MSRAFTRLPLRYVVTAALLVPPPAFSQAADTAASIRTLLEFEDSRFAAMIVADTTWLRNALADDMTYVHSSARLETKSQYLQSVGSRLLRYEQFVPRDRHVHWLGGEAAAVAGIAHARALSGGQLLDGDVRYLAVYERLRGSWQLKAWQTTRVP